MGLKCSLLGHDYGDVEVERNREEQGNEVVETVREVKRCERCDAETVVSENTEVRTAVDAADVGLDEDDVEAGAGVEADAESAESELESAVTRVGGEAEAAGESGADTDAEHESRFDDVTAGDAADHPRVDSDDGFEPATEAAEDDAIILDDEDEEPVEPEREPGQWPEADDTRQEERGAEVLQAADAEAGTGADVEADVDGESAEAAAESESETDDGSGGIEAGDWPEQEGEDEGFVAEPGGSTSDAEVSVDDGFDAEFIDGTGERSVDDVSGEGADGLACPECGFDAGDSASLREGDICPECHRGYLNDATSE